MKPNAKRRRGPVDKGIVIAGFHRWDFFTRRQSFHAAQVRENRFLASFFLYN
jgi:hypothetical protein